MTGLGLLLLWFAVSLSHPRGSGAAPLPPDKVGGDVLEHLASVEPPPFTAPLFATESAEAARDHRPDVPDAQVRRLLVEISPRTWEDLTRMMQRDSHNASTVVNRAVQVYAHLSDTQAHGAQLLIAEDDGATSIVHFK